MIVTYKRNDFFTCQEFTKLHCWFNFFFWYKMKIDESTEYSDR